AAGSGRARARPAGGSSPRGRGRARGGALKRGETEAGPPPPRRDRAPAAPAAPAGALASRVARAARFDRKPRRHRSRPVVHERTRTRRVRAPLPALRGEPRRTRADRGAARAGGRAVGPRGTRSHARREPRPRLPRLSRAQRLLTRRVDRGTEPRAGAVGARSRSSRARSGAVVVSQSHDPLP